MNTPERYGYKNSMEVEYPVWYAVGITALDFIVLFPFYWFILATVISPPLYYPSSSPQPHQKKPFIVLATEQSFHYHLPPHLLSTG